MMSFKSINSYKKKNWKEYWGWNSKKFEHMKTLGHDECRWEHGIPRGRTDEGWKV
jgi:hypothetical protein